MYIVSQPADKSQFQNNHHQYTFLEKRASLHNALPVLVLLSVKVMLSELVMLATKVALQTGLHGDELLLKLRW